MKNLKLKTKVFDFFRQFGKLPFIEDILFLIVKNQYHTAFLSRLLLPRWYLYRPTEYRDVVRNGIKFRLYPMELVDYWVFFQLVVEPRNLLYSLIKPNFVAFDIGTNMGETLLNFAKRCPQGVVHGFEPIPFLYKRAVYNVHLNNFENIILNNMALSDKEEWLDVGDAVEYNSGSTFLIKSTKQEQNQQVRATTVDSYIAQNKIEKIDFMKLDVEGFEMHVLHGAKQTLLSFHPLLFIEIDDVFLRRQGSSASELIRYLKEFGYQTKSAQSKLMISEKDNFENCHFDIIAIPN